MAKESAPTTHYVILAEAGGTIDAWIEVARLDARSREEALRNGTVVDGEQREGKFKAIPGRSWDSTVRIQAEVKTVARMTEVSGNGSEATIPFPADVA